MATEVTNKPTIADAEKLLGEIKTGAQSLIDSGAIRTEAQIKADPTPSVSPMVADETAPETMVDLPEAPGVVVPDGVDMTIPEVATETVDAAPEVTEQTDLARLAAGRVEAMTKAFDERRTGAEIRAGLEEEARLTEKRDLQNQYQTDLNSIYAQGNATVLRALNQAEDRDVPKSIYNAQVSRIERDTAIRALPVQALLSAAQGDLQMAQTHVDNLFKIEMADAQAQYQFKADVIESVYDLADKEEQRQFDQLKLIEAREFEAEKADMEMKRDLLKSATSQGAPASVVQAISQAKTGEEAIQAAGQYGQDILARQIQQANLEKARRAPTTVIDRGDGMKQLINSQTGEVIMTYGSGAGEGFEAMTEDQKAVRAMEVNSIADLATHSGLNSAVGPVGLTRVALADVSGAKDEFIGVVENMVDTLTLQTFADAKEKGMTFGAMSQGEWDILAKSATAIGNWRERDDGNNVTGYDVSEKAFKKELDRLTQYAKRDFVLRGGVPEDVGVEVTDDGKYWMQNSDGSLTELSIPK